MMMYDWTDQLMEILLFSFIYYMMVIRASYFTLKVSFWSKQSSYSSTAYTRTPYSCRPPRYYSLLQKGSKQSYSMPRSPYSYSLPRKKSRLSLPQDLSTCLRIRSTDSLRMRKTLTVPSMSSTLLPIAIRTVPRKIQLFSSISGLYIRGAVKSIFSNQRESLEVERWKQGLRSSGVRVSRGRGGRERQKWQWGQESYCLCTWASSSSSCCTLRERMEIFCLSRSFVSASLLCPRFRISLLLPPSIGQAWSMRSSPGATVACEMARSSRERLPNAKMGIVSLDSSSFYSSSGLLLPLPRFESLFYFTPMKYKQFLYRISGRGKGGQQPGLLEGGFVLLGDHPAAGEGELEGTVEAGGLVGVGLFGGCELDEGVLEPGHDFFEYVFDVCVGEVHEHVLHDQQVPTVPHLPHRLDVLELHVARNHPRVEIPQHLVARVPLALQVHLPSDPPIPEADLHDVPHPRQIDGMLQAHQIVHVVAELGTGALPPAAFAPESAEGLLYCFGGGEDCERCNEDNHYISQLKQNNLRMGSAYLSQPVTEKHVVVGTAKGYNFCMAEMQGWRNEMEDASILERDLGDGNALFAVFDGHGGREVSKYVAAKFKGILLGTKEYKQKRWAQALDVAFREMDEMLASNKGTIDLNAERNVHISDPISRNTGCTANVLLLTTTHIYVANAGDSRSVLCRSGEAVPLSIDHKPEDAGEIKRIRNAGGVIHMGRVNGGLNLTRSFGDFEYKQNKSLSYSEQMITCKPQVREFERKQGQDEFVIIGCDGIWEKYVDNSQGLINLLREMISQKLEDKSVLQKLLDQLLASDPSEGVGCDNMTCVLLHFK